VQHLVEAAAVMLEVRCQCYLAGYPMKWECLRWKGCTNATKPSASFPYPHEKHACPASIHVCVLSTCVWFWMLREIYSTIELCILITNKLRSKPRIQGPKWSNRKEFLTILFERTAAASYIHIHTHTVYMQIWPDSIWLCSTAPKFSGGPSSDRLGPLRWLR